ncbi:hypothetical protein NEA10_12365 [Phormidium yuhuli AB48]|uniref:DUF2892 domain-containing protein n=1 Tax=Phormidium yuhuli AB48 TaxID=2940671 RepID=A0ABY5AKM5_9CYAN|nr:hypothetical protein [Phormidium yuhuli]USR89672.1 hypothetical protein NEA10_12365 [Phormidium yuhuli AB48]
MSDPSPRRRLDRLQTIARFSGGFLFGVIAAFFSPNIWGVSVLASLLSIGLLGLCCGLLAVLFGDRFWSFLSRWF